jgi:hypothetical protein
MVIGVDDDVVSSEQAAATLAAALTLRLGCFLDTVIYLRSGAEISHHS